MLSFEDILLAIHLLSVAIGAGSGYLIVILHQVERAQPGCTTIYGSYRPLAWMLRGGLAVLIISGWVLVGDWGAAWENTIFLWKLFFVALIVIDSIVVAGILTPKFREACEIQNTKERENRTESLERVSFMLGMLQVVSWTLVIALSAFTHIG